MRPALAVFDRTGVLVWSLEDVALLREEALGRLEVTSCRGEVAHCPGPLSEAARAPLVEVTPGTWVHPRHATRDGVLPGGWRVEGCEALPDPVPPPDPPVPEIPARLSQVLWVERGRWVTEAGSFPTDETPTALARRHPWLVRMGHVWVNVHRVERLDRDGGGWRVTLRGADGFRIGPDAFSSFCDALGSGREHPSGGEGPVAALYRNGLRDWPADFLYWEAEALQQHFGTDAGQLMMQVIWQVKRLLESGRADHPGQDIRALYYRPVGPVLRRAGFAALTADWESDPLYRQFEILLARMVGEWRLLTYTELHFRDTRPDLRRIGQHRPEILVCAEKAGLMEDTFALAERFGVSAVVLGGNPSLFGTEMLAAALARVLPSRVLWLVTFVDWDVGGWGVWRGLVSQLERYGFEVRLLGHLVRPERFTAWEIEHLSFPIPTGESTRAKAEKWLEETGGIGGELRGMHSDHLRPFGRVEAAFQEETGLEPVA